MDRDAQRRILTGLAEIYPQMADPDSLQAEVGGDDYDKNLFYLQEHGLVKVGITDLMDGGIVFGPPRITAKGMDFLENDGGMSAILNTVTVRLHDDTIRDLLIRQVDKAEGPAPLKAQLIAAIRAAPAKALSQVADHAVRQGIESLPDAVGQLQRWLLP